MTDPAPGAKFPIVGIGASAGGVEALEGFFSGLPEHPGFAVVIVTHLNPERESLLHAIVSRYTHLPVHVAQHDVRVEPNTVHVLPADAILTIKEGRLLIRTHEPTQRERKPIDIFLASLAKDVGDYAVSVVLSGGDGDGTLGTKAIKENGGLTLAQAPDGHGPAHPDMPESATSTGMVDFYLPADQMGAKLAEHARSFELLEAMATAEEGAHARADAEAARDTIYRLLRSQIGHDFEGYKTKTFMRRVHRRMQVAHLTSLEAYVEKLKSDPKEVGVLFHDLLINVTNFFRDADSFERLAELVIPRLFEGRGASDTVRVWVPGCATGEEVFSIAILMREHMDGLTAPPKVNIFATDIDEKALVVARSGRYPEALLDSVSPERRKRFFIPDGGSFVVSKEVRDLCIFSPHSVIRDPPFSRMDLVSCRNLLIYFGPHIQGQVIPTFHYSLRPSGYLFLGGSENVSQFGDLFAPLDKKHRIFRSRDNGQSRLPLALAGRGKGASLSYLAAGGSHRSSVSGVALRQMVEQQVLDRFAPPHVVANRDGEVVYYSARTGKYLEPPTGAPSRQLLSMARKGLRLDLRTAFREAVEQNKTVTRASLELESDDGRIQLVNLTIEPIPQEMEDEPLLLVLFSDEGEAVSREDAKIRADSQRSGAADRLEMELRDTRDRLQSLIEEYETALEELKSSNEELVSVNEELQSTNEELEASKEELQSLNEELHTVNSELNDKVEALDRTNADLQNLFESTRIGTIFLDHRLVIRSFTPSVKEVFNILPSDRGRPITDLSSRLSMPTMAEDVRTVLADEREVERHVVTKAGDAHFLVRLAPYRDGDRKTEGVVVTFADITAIAEAEAAHRTLIDELNHRVKNMLTVVIGMLEQTLKTAAPDTFREVFLGRLHAMARSYELLTHEKWGDVLIGAQIRQELSPFGMERVECDGPDIRLKPRQALALGMVLHELATNAAKYGALSAADGRVHVDWRQTGEKVELHWAERDGPEIAKPSRRGLGLKLVERETASGLGGAASLDFAPNGLTVSLDFKVA
jgi:two-component system, chemotaxis family, CheB/CheR fusion protein